MPSMKSCFNRTLYRKQLARFWPLWGLYLLLWTIVMPAFQIVSIGNSALSGSGNFATGYVLDLAATVAPWIAAVYALLSAMAVWAYLYNSRSVGMLHSLPMHREGIFLTNYLAGMTFVVLPNAVVFLLTLGAESLAGKVDAGALCLWLIIQILLGLFFFSFATLVAFFTGSLPALPALYVIFNGLALGVTTLLDMTFSNFVYGYSFGTSQTMNWLGKWLTPLYVLSDRLNVTWQTTAGGTLSWPELHGLPVVVGLAAVGLVMAAVALLLYRNRKLELAGEVIAVLKLRPVFKYGVAVCGGLAFGNIFYALFQSVLPNGVGGMLFFLLLWGAVFYFAAEMLLKKSFRVFRKSWKGCVVLLALLAAALLAMEFDVSGYEKDVPSADSVASVEVNGHYSYYGDGDAALSEETASDPAYIAQVVALHKTMVDNKQGVETWLAGLKKRTGWTSLDQNGLSYQTEGTQWVELSYRLKNGNQLVRYYQVPVSETLLADASSPAAQLAGIYNDPQRRAEAIFPKQLQREDLVTARVDCYEINNGQSGSYGYWDDSHTVTLTAEEARSLYDAVLEDLSAGRLGRVWLLQNEAFYKTQYANTLYFTFYGPYQTLYYGGEDSTDYTDYTVTVTLQSTAASTLSVLGQMGLVEGVDLWSQRDYQRAQYHYNRGDDAEQEESALPADPDTTVVADGV